MCGKFFTGAIVLIALLLAVFGAFLSPDHMDALSIVVISVARFFDMMLPVLAVGALLKYLCSCPFKDHCKKKDEV
jgi:cytochrome c biogenesis factor